MNLNTSHSKSIYCFKVENHLDRLSTETTTCLNRQIANSSSMDYKRKKISMEPRKLFTLESTCSKVKKLDKCILNHMEILKQVNKRKEITSGKSTLRILGSEKYKKMLFITKSTKYCLRKVKTKNSLKPNLFHLI